MPKFTVPHTPVTLLTWTSKMSCASWSLPAGGPACPSMNGTICQSCYAQSGMYRAPVVQNAQRVRWEWTRQSMQTLAGTAAWTAHMIAAIRHEVAESKHKGYSSRHFRIHDSGDFFAPNYCVAWAQVAQALPSIKFWAPTRRWQLARARGACQTPAGTHFKILTDDDRMLGALRLLAQLPNVTIRPSALDFDSDVPAIPGLTAGSGAVTDAWGVPATGAPPGAKLCPASLNSSSCEAEGCRHCWDNKTQPVFYLKH
jgi:hypothetical protein